MASENAMMNSADGGLAASQSDASEARKPGAVMGPDAPLSVNPQATTAPDTLSASTPPKPAILRPALRGVLKRVGPLVKWEGQWGMDDNAFNGGIVSEFSYLRDRVHENQDTNDVANSLAPGDDSDLVCNAKFSGYFYMVLNAKKKKVAEKDVQFEFMRDESLPAGTVKVVGSGTNQYGNYSLEGTLVLATGALNVYREYKYEQRPSEARRPAARRAPASRKPVQRKPSRSSLDGIVLGPDPVSTLAKNPPRMRRAPSHLVEDSFDDRTQQDLIKMKGIVRDLMRSDKEGWYHAPVDAEALGLTTYHDIVKEPMDLGTIMKNLESRAYSSYEEAARHVRLTFNNSMAFNPPANGVHQSAKHLLGLFENQLEKLERSKYRRRKSTIAAGSPADPNVSAPSSVGDKSALKRTRSEEASTNGSSVAGRGRRTMSDLFSSDEEDNDDDDDISDDGDITAGVTSAPAKKRSKTMGQASRRASAAVPAATPAAAVPAVAPREVVPDEVQLLREQVLKMEQQLQQFRDKQANGHASSMLPAHSHAISGPPAAAPMPVEAPRPVRRERSSNDVRRLSYQEMRQLGQDINKLPGDMIQGVIKIIQESGQPLGEDGDEVELDIEALDPPALKKLQKYVKRCLTKARKKQGRDEIDEF